jgi:uncharacterized protein YggE
MEEWLRMDRKGLLLSIFVTATVLLMSACSYNPANPASAQSSPVSTSPTGVLSQTAIPQDNAMSGRVITVVGTGQAFGTPDVATVNIGVETQSASVQQAVTENSTRMNKILMELKGQGIADKDIRTSNYSVFTDQQPNPTGTTPITPTLFYRVSNQVSVMVRDVSKIGNVMDTVVSAGANNIFGVNFSVAEPSKLEGDARAKAMADAKERAQNLAILAGVSLGDVVNVSEVVNSPAPLLRSEVAASVSGNTPIQPGSLDITMSVQVSYEIR